MKDAQLLNDSALLSEIGTRVSKARIDRKMTQAELADQAGIGKRTLERLENGESVQLTTFLRILRVLSLLPSIDQLLPAQPLHPLAIIKEKEKPRSRVKHAKNLPIDNRPSAQWKWGDES